MMAFLHTVFVSSRTYSCFRGDCIIFIQVGFLLMHTSFYLHTMLSDENMLSAACSLCGFMRIMHDVYFAYYGCQL